MRFEFNRMLTNEEAEKIYTKVLKKEENNKSAFYPKINGFLFGSIKNYRYLCIVKETIL